MTNESVKPPTWFWIIAVVTLIWNLLGVFAYLGEVYAPPEVLEVMPEEQRMMIEQHPVWATGAYAIAVWGGFLGCLLLLFKRKFASILLILSLSGVIIHMIYNLFIADATISYGFAHVIVTILIPLIGIGLILLAKKGKNAGWLR